MKQTLIIILLSIPVILPAQSEAVDEFFAKYKGTEDVISLSIGRILIHMGSWFIQDPATKSIARKAKRVRLLVNEDKNMVDPEDVTWLVRNLNREHFEELMTVRSDGTYVQILGREDERYLRDLILLVDEEDEFALVTVRCKMTYDELESLMADIE
ncbi:MAG: DUF4252 domain-containing protein [Saprospiraceae bacterium]|nr:DUF4252 domain-containing protein [Saprospiraceae bacterium]